MFDKLITFAEASNNIGSLVAGFLVFLLSGFVVFFIRDFVKKPPSFSGCFYLKTTTTQSSMGSYVGLSSHYMMTLIYESATKSIGKLEKIYDIEKDGNYRPYTGRDRNIGDVTLIVERYYLRPNRMNILITFHGDQNKSQRPSSLVANFKYAKKNTKGQFVTTAADSSGIAIFQQEKFVEITPIERNKTSDSEKMKEPSSDAKKTYET
ncbi:hypothetical protein ETAR_14840 [Edwardsiella tarda]